VAKELLAFARRDGGEKAPAELTLAGRRTLELAAGACSEVALV